VRQGADRVEAHHGADGANDTEGGEDAEDDADEAVQAPLQAAALAGHLGRVHHRLHNAGLALDSRTGYSCPLHVRLAAMSSI